MWLSGLGRGRAFGLWLAVSFVAVTGAPRVSFAEGGTDAAAARALFTAARALVKAQNYAEACPKFVESLKLDRGIGTQYNLADCWEHLGRTASAWAAFLDTAAAARAAGQTERQRVAQQRADALVPKLSRLTIEVTAPEPGLEVSRDGASVGSAVWGTPVPVDPGTHTLQARAAGKGTWSRQVEVTADTTVRVPALATLAASAARVRGAKNAIEPALPVEPTPSHATVPPASAEAHSSSSGRRAVSITLLGVGVAGLALGTVFALDYRSKNNSAKSICPQNNNCQPGDQSRHDEFTSQASTARTRAYVGFGAGVAACVAAAIVHFSGGSAPSSAGARGLRATPLVGSSGWGAELEHSF